LSPQAFLQQLLLGLEVASCCRMLLLEHCSFRMEGLSICSTPLCLLTERLGTVRQVLVELRGPRICGLELHLSFMK
jgi:hypothetical protein